MREFPFRCVLLFEITLFLIKSVFISFKSSRSVTLRWLARSLFVMWGGFRGGT